MAAKQNLASGEILPCWFLYSSGVIGMKLVIQIPCFNEAEFLPLTLAELPRQVAGFDVVEVIVIDDGSTDSTAQVARAHGVAHVIQLAGHQGLARAFMAGLLTSLAEGADVIVNTDADNQYCSADIQDLVEPIISGVADVVVGTRRISEIQHFSATKRLLQKLGSAAIRRISGTNVLDVPSGFRAFSRDAARRLNVFGRFTYTVEIIIQAGCSNLRIANVPIRVNGPTRPSRLFRGNLHYISRIAFTTVSVFLIYRPVLAFGLLATGSLVAGMLIGLRYLYYMNLGQGIGHIQSVVLCSIFLLAGLFLSAIGVVAHLVAINRRLLEEVRYLALRQGASGLATADKWRNGILSPLPAANGEDQSKCCS
jgi:glycosyltransferase involved in cell wall biosynthesis